MLENKKLTYAIAIVVILIGVLMAVLLIPQLFSGQKNKNRVVLGYEGQADYIAAVQADPTADKDVLYKKYVTDIYQEACLGGGLVDPPPGDGSIVPGHPLGNLEELSEYVRVLRQAPIEKVAKITLQQAEKALPASKATVCIFALDPLQSSFFKLNMHGVYGQTCGPGIFLVEIAPQGDWFDWLPYTIAHEYHHTVLFQDYYPVTSGEDLTDYLIMEGKADAFAHTLYPDIVAPWTSALTAEKELIQWQAMQADLTSKEQTGRFMFGDAQVPMWTGYTIGFHIVQKYIQAHPDASVEEWTRMDSHQLLKESGYSGQP